MQHEIPQFIDIEDRVIGPFTFPQFAYLFGGGGTGYLLLKIFGGMTGFILGGTVLGFGLILAFFKYNGRSFAQILQSMTNYMLRGKLFVWQKNHVVSTAPKKKIILEEQKIEKPKRNISDVSKGLDILDRL